jgi:hypothetical protein
MRIKIDLLGTASDSDKDKPIEKIIIENGAVATSMILEADSVYEIMLVINQELQKLWEQWGHIDEIKEELFASEGWKEALKDNDFATAVRKHTDSRLMN